MKYSSVLFFVVGITALAIAIEPRAGVSFDEARAGFFVFLALADLSFVLSLFRPKRPAQTE